VPTATPASSSLWTEKEITFTSGSDELFGILTLPASTGPYPAIVSISGSEDPYTGLRDGASSQLHVVHARTLVLDGFAVLRYDPPGVGRSTGDHRIKSLDKRAEEAIAAVKYLQTHADIQPDRIGLWANSQGSWVIAMAAAEHPKDVAFIISVSGAGVSVAEQQVYGVEAQSKAAGLSEEDITKAVLFSRLLIDWQLSNPIYREVNEADAQRLGDGPWSSFIQLVYESGAITPAEGLQAEIKILESIQDESWAKSLYLRTLVLPQLRSISPDQMQALKAAADQSLLIDPKYFLPKVHCPVLAFFGQADRLLPAARSAALYELYLAEARNDNYKIFVFPGADHSLNGLMPAYWETLSNWLEQLCKE
jgi:pimeloyl-ACP methyl ester carboxylesterase